MTTGLLTALLASCGLPAPPPLPTPPPTSPVPDLVPTSVPTAPPPSDAELAAALLTAADIGGSYRSIPIEANAAGGLGDGVTQCGEAASDDGATPGGRRAEAGFQGGQLGPFVAEVLTALPQTDAQRAMAAFRRAMQECAEFTSSGDLSGVTIRLEQLSFPTMGDETFAYRVIAAAGGGLVLYGHVVAVRHRDVLVLITLMQVGSPEVGPTAEIVAKAVDKLKRVRR
ncbi:hypothetical protein [Micromonospora sp. NPDC047134]|uniref:hypothetical protein n=1 Tax=Micromonospora sp. NPDC047134 TaxID=3154340 RepID=UPI0033EE0917